MKKKIIYTFILLVSIVIQTSVLTVITKTSVAGDAVAMAVLVFSVVDGFFAFLGWAIFAGILYDLACYSPIGTHVIIFLCIVYFTSFFSRRFSVERKFVRRGLFFMLVIAATFLLRAIIALETAWEMRTLRGYWEVFGNLKIFVFQIICNMILFLLWLVVIKKIKTFFKLET